MDEPTTPARTISRYSVGNKHRGYSLCPHCGAANSVTLLAITTALEKGLASQQFDLVAKTDPPGTVLGMLAPLIRLFKDKGWKVKT
jgi:hypothetical protein